MARGLPPLLAAGLDVVFVGTEPGPESLRTQSYYANSRNSFWRDLFEAGLTPTLVAPSAYSSVLALGIGLDDVYQDPPGFRRRIETVAPRAVCFNSKAALARVAIDRIEGPWAGADAARWTNFAGAIVWALHDSSPTAVAYRPLRLRELAALVERIGLAGD
jgi:G:T/U-mismatch repair DNA glycosylase